MFTLTLAHLLAKTILPRGYGGVHKTCGNSGGVGGLFLCSRNGNSGKEGGRGGDLSEIPSIVGVWIFSGTTQCLNKLLYVFFVCIFRCYDQSSINSTVACRTAKRLEFLL